jgi:Ca2+/Na+ antiporter
VVNIINTLLCLTIVIAGWIAFKKARGMTVMMITIAFFLFFVSHLITFLGLDSSLENAQIVIRIIAYLSALYSVTHIFSEKKNE